MPEYVFKVTGRVWDNQDYFYDYSIFKEIDSSALPIAYKCLQAYLFDQFASETHVFRARFIIETNDGSYSNNMGIGACYNFNSDELDGLRKDILSSKNITGSIKKLITKYPWVTGTDIASAVKMIFPNLSGEVTQLIWNWSDKSKYGITDSELDARVIEQLKEILISEGEAGTSS
jgi:hypothetical protein